MNPLFFQYGTMKTKKILIITNRIIAPDLTNLGPKFWCKAINLNSGPEFRMAGKVCEWKNQSQAGLSSRFESS